MTLTEQGYDFSLSLEPFFDQICVLVQAEIL